MKINAICALLLLTALSAVAENPLTQILQGSTNKYTVSADQTVLTFNGDWYKPYVYTDLSTPYTLSKNSPVTFEFDLNISDANSAGTVALLGTTKTLVLGYACYNHDNVGYNLHYAIADGNTTQFYSNATNGVSFNNLLDASATVNTPYTLTGTVSWNGSDYVLDVAVNGTTAVSGISLGLAEDAQEVFSRVVFSAESPGGGVTFSNVSVVPEPTTATLSLLALAGLVARRRRK